MPTYTYDCKSCGHRFDHRQAFTDPALTVCPRCDGRLRKVLSSVGIVFKGSGFYRTDSRASSAGGALAGAAEAKGAPSVKSSSGDAAPKAGADSKPASPKDTAKQPAAVH
jgi:putative FmdB family regulatory protein